MRNTILTTALALCLGATAANAFDLNRASNTARAGAKAVGNVTGRAMCAGYPACGTAMGYATGKVYDAGQAFTGRYSPKVQKFGRSLRRD